MLASCTPTGAPPISADTGSETPDTCCASDTDTIVGSKLIASDGHSADQFGSSVAGAGDVDGDGYDDVAVGAPRYGPGTQSAGSVYLFFGGAEGLDAASELRLMATDGAAGDGFGHAVDGAGDVDGDGLDDLVVGAQGQLGADSGAGAATVLFGGARDVFPAHEQAIGISDPDAYFAHSVAGAGDVNSDGYQDIVVSAPRDGSASELGGAVYLLLGGSGGVDLESEQKLLPSAPADYARFGGSVSRGGDVNGDGFADVVVGAPRDPGGGDQAGAVYLYFGATSGLSTSREDSLWAPDGSALHEFGHAVAGGGDIDDDGFDDLVVGDYYANRAFVYYGSSGGVDPSRWDELFNPRWGEGQWFGLSVSVLGDANADGFDDILVGASWNSHLSAFTAGEAFVYFGSATGLRASDQVTLGAFDAGEGDQLGEAVSGAGDVDGDGRGDVIVGAPWDDDLGGASGSAWLFRGCSEDGSQGLCPPEG